MFGPGKLSLAARIALLTAAVLGISFLCWYARLCPGFFYAREVQKPAQPNPRLAPAERKPLVAVGDFKTYFNPAQTDRVHNIRLAAKALDGFCLRPGQILSFNAVVGPRTVGRGYREALVIEGEKFVPGIGGGVCQVSTTLYNAALLAGLKIVERTAHGLKVDYVEPGLDATVVDGLIDLKIGNPYKDNFLLKTRVGADYLQIAFYGPRHPWHIEIEMEVEVLPPPKKVIYDPNLRPPQSFITSPGRPGYNARVWRLYKSGEVIERREFISEDVYMPLPEEIRVGVINN